MLKTRQIPNWPNNAMEEFQVNFEKLDKWFAVLQNVQATLKISDWNNLSNTTSLFSYLILLPENINL